jgi:hypothetical protein
MPTSGLSAAGPQLDRSASLSAAEAVRRATGGRRQRALREHRISLQRHVKDCRDARSRWFSLGCAAELMHGALAPRFVTTVTAVVVALAISACWL